MREIKFRGKRKDNGEWVYGYYFISERDIEDGFVWRDIPQIQQRYGDHYQYFDVMPETIGQYTGLKDKNGKEIYEGDIVKMHYFFENLDPYTLGVFEDETEVTGTVRIDPFGTYTETEKVTFDWGDYLQEPSEELEIIGDIYENPDLMEETNND